MDYQILIEADYLVNADESEYSGSNIRQARKSLFRTGTGIKLLDEIWRIQNEVNR